MYAINGLQVEAPDTEQWSAYEIGVDHVGRVRRSPFMRLAWTKRVDNGYVSWQQFEGRRVSLTTRPPHSLREFVTYDAICQRVVSTLQHGLKTDVSAEFLVYVG